LADPDGLLEDQLLPGFSVTEKVPWASASFTLNRSSQDREVPGSTGPIPMRAPRFLASSIISGPPGIWRIFSNRPSFVGFCLGVWSGGGPPFSTSWTSGGGVGEAGRALPDRKLRSFCRALSRVFGVFFSGGPAAFSDASISWTSDGGADEADSFGGSFP